MIRDRGRIKWTAMMLPEHLAELREWVAEDAYEEQPDIDEWTLQEFQKQLDIACQSGCEIRVRTWENGKTTNTTGILKGLDHRLKTIYIADGSAVHRLSLETLVGIETIGLD